MEDCVLLEHVFSNARSCFFLCEVKAGLCGQPPNRTPGSCFSAFHPPVTENCSVLRKRYANRSQFQVFYTHGLPLPERMGECASQGPLQLLGLAGYLRAPPGARQLCATRTGDYISEHSQPFLPGEGLRPPSPQVPANSSSGLPSQGAPLG